MPSEGYIAIARRFFDHPLWTERREFSKAEAWIDILSETRYIYDKPNDPNVFWIGGEEIECRRGQVVHSFPTWARRWGWTDSRAKRFVAMLQTHKMVRSEGFKKTVRLTICNYDIYNTPRTGSELVANRQRTGSELIADPSEEGKKEKEQEETAQAPCGDRRKPLIPEHFARTEMETRLAAWCIATYNRKPITEWTAKEVTKFRVVAKRADLVEEANTIGKARKGGWEYARKSVQTLLNNWPSEVEKARAFLAEAEPYRPQSAAEAGGVLQLEDAR